MVKTKSDIRKEILAQRKKLSSEEVTLLSEKIINNLVSTEEYELAKDILVYCSYNNEVETRNLINIALDDDKNVYLPKVHGDSMDFYCINDLSELVPGKMGIMEPLENDCNKYNGKPYSLVIMPLSAYDKNGNRIGYGGGFYDKYLASHIAGIRIGIAFSFQEFKDIPAEETDIKLNYIINEKEVINLYD